VTLVLVTNDGLADSAADIVRITIVQSDAGPVCSAAAPSSPSLWPPNHGMVPISIFGVTDPDGDQVRIMITRVTQDEPVDGLGDGDTAPDAVIKGATALIRAERSGEGNGRAIVISFTADDGRGGACSGTVAVSAPHSAKSRAIDDGQRYDATKTTIK
jgi:hypothetical protein